MEIAYYPGCTLFEKAKEFDKLGRDIASLFGYTLCDIPDWTCCGTVFPNTLSYAVKFASPYRTLAAAEAMGDKLLTLCSACYNVLKRSNKVIKENSDIKEKLKNYTEVEYKGTVEVIHYLEFLRDIVTFDKIKEKVKQNNNKNVAPYYGCLLLRPHEELKFDDPENPQVLSDIINLVGDKASAFPSQNECCGAYTTIIDKDEKFEISKEIKHEAKNFGAEFLITSCPLCHFNLNKTEGGIRTVYFTEYLASVLGVK